MTITGLEGKPPQKVVLGETDDATQPSLAGSFESVLCPQRIDGLAKQPRPRGQPVNVQPRVSRPARNGSASAGRTSRSTTPTGRPMA